MPSGEAAEVELKPTDEEGIFKGAYSPKEIGHYGLEVNFADEPIPKFPFFVPVCDPAAVRLDGPGLECAICLSNIAGIKNDYNMCVSQVEVLSDSSSFSNEQSLDGLFEGVRNAK